MRDNQISVVLFSLSHGLIVFLIATNLVSVKYNHLCSLSNGFLPPRSDISCSIYLFNGVLNLRDSGHSTIVVCSNFANAFDKVSHKRILSNTVAYAIHGHLLSWLQTFLTSRYQNVCINSNESHCPSGVIQGGF